MHDPDSTMTKDRRHFSIADRLDVARCTGADATAFLQGQFTSDIAALAPFEWGVSGYCSAKGRLLGIFLVFRDRDSFWLATHASLLEGLIKRLRRYVLRAQVDFEMEQKWQVGFRTGVAMQKPLTPSHDLTPPGRPYPGAPLEVLLFRQMTSSQRPTPPAGLTTGNGEIDFSLACIQAGLPVLQPQTQELLIPQSVNLDLIEGVSFKKGCYPGQEIIARVRYRGKPKQRMVRAFIESEKPIRPGTAVDTSPVATGQTGTVVNASPHQTAPGWEMLVSLPVSCLARKVDPGLSIGGKPVTLRPLPYLLPLPGD